MGFSLGTTPSITFFLNNQACIEFYRLPPGVYFERESFKARFVIALLTGEKSFHTQHGFQPNSEPDITFSTLA